MKLPGNLLFRLTVVLTGLFGLVLGAGGLWLVLLGGSFYYLAASLLLILTAAMLARRDERALWVYALLLFGTLAWALWEAGLDFWALVPRGDVLVPLGVWLLLPFVQSELEGPGYIPISRRATRPLQTALLASLAVLAVSLFRDPHDIAGDLPRAGSYRTAAARCRRRCPMATGAPMAAPSSATAIRRSTQITPENVKDLKLAWTSAPAT